MVFLKNKKGAIFIEKYSAWADEEEFKVVDVRIGNNGKKRRVINISGTYGSDISCGVSQAHGLPRNENMLMLLSVINGSYKTSSQRKKAIKDLFIKVFQPMSCKFIMLSDRKNTDHSVIHKILSDISDTETGWYVNPNSGNKIKVWVYRKGKR